MKTNFESLASALKSADIDFTENVDLSSFSYMRTGGKARIVIFPNSKEKLALSLQLASTNHVTFKLIGNTSNLLFLDDAEYSCLIVTTALNTICMESEGTIFAEAGVMVPELARFALFNSLTGMEGLEGIPGTLGGGIFMNAGAYGSEIRDCLESVETVNSQGEFKNYSAKDIGLTHRSSILRKQHSDTFVYACRFKLKKGNEKSIYSKMEIFHAKRHRYQDFMYPNLGSIFSGSPYRAMAKKDVVFGLALRAFMFLGYKIQVLGRESPINRRWINNLAVKRFNLTYSRQPFSDKTINCLVNRGQGTAEMVRYIRELGSIINDRAPLENEIVSEF
jgi:UDP-N-acetylmuramate dehydrogenase